MVTLSNITKIIITMSVGITGAAISKKARLPAAFMTGSMLAVIAYGLLSGMAYFPIQFKPVVQAIAGGAIGVSINKTSINGLKHIAKPVTIYVLSLVGTAMIASYFMSLITPLSWVTSLLSCAPGGIVEMSLLSYEFNANTSHITILQMMRLITALGVFPSLTRAYLNKYANGNSTEQTQENTPDLQQNVSIRRSVIPTFLVLAAGGVIGNYSGLPAGVLTGSMLFVAAFQIKTGRASMSVKTRRVAQIVAGTMVGATMTINDLISMNQLVIPFIIVFVEYLVLNYIVGPFIAKKFTIDLTTMLLACTPAGVSDMALIAGEMGGDQAKVAVFQIARLTSVLLIFPCIARFLY